MSRSPMTRVDSSRLLVAMLVAGLTACTAPAKHEASPQTGSSPTATAAQPLRVAAPSSRATPCPSMRPTSIRTVVLRAVQPPPQLVLRVGDRLRAVARSRWTLITAPRATKPALRRVRVSAPGCQRTADFVAVRPGRTFVLAEMTGIPSGAAMLVYAAIITVR
jgi:hypothetical protein